MVAAFTITTRACTQAPELAAGGGDDDDGGGGGSGRRI